MVEGFEELKKFDYPGRFIGLGKRADGKKIIALYGITGRSESSQNRKMIDKSKDDVWTWSVNVKNKKGVDKKQLPLLVYDSLITKNYDTLVISNGAQTNLLAKFMDEHNDPQSILIKAMSTGDNNSDYPKDWYMQKVKGRDDINLTWYEPDNPIFTPRIFGALKNDMISLGISKRTNNDELPLRFYSNSMSMKPKEEGPYTKEDEGKYIRSGEGKLIATYNGDRDIPKPFGYGSSKIKLVDIGLRGSLEDITNGVWDAMHPDLAVVVGGMFIDPTNKTVESKIIYRS